MREPILDQVASSYALISQVRLPSYLLRSSRWRYCLEFAHLSQMIIPISLPHQSHWTWCSTGQSSCWNQMQSLWSSSPHKNLHPCPFLESSGSFTVPAFDPLVLREFRSFARQSKSWASPDLFQGSVYCLYASLRSEWRFVVNSRSS